jgi:glycosyltransferase involved in cell wall biosynthesis
MVIESKLIVLPNGVDAETWRPDSAVRIATRRELGLGKEFLWFAAGRLEPVKDYPALLRAFAQSRDASRLAIAGGGPLQNELARMTAALGLENRVLFLGFQTDIRRWMQAADGFILASQREGLPIGLLEAAACALPAVATDVPGTREVIVDGHTGWLAPACDAAALGETMNRMMQTPLEERRAMGERARQMVIERYSLHMILDKWEALYMGLLK